ncbi:hypothetical protein [Actinomadura rudentiformis]|uniref:Uncharacterized protein n=1 Tax=Actinomadura rudentiformis TaxID=359158 RepID=A0A6H9YVX6_9ACTN|nr:hypothetical protein [Actinomadura rudentiformis]KAB2344856.1 hypothetical protein F8566_30150 [Actinomadura rudentiformis]
MGAARPFTLIAYGYDLGGFESRTWKVTETNQHGHLDVPWLVDDEFEACSAAHLENVTGRRLDELGVEFLCYGTSLLNHDWVLAAAGDYVVTEQERHALKEQQCDAWDDALARVLPLLGFTPLQPAPAWLELAAWL